ncbi:hypothetical protein PoB_001047000 [Plakobranchus ocellatus]|uniref:Apple domain-containing protein n=1 Tax=Plakobranchus ocellatus TaxID=259542 RepID=A0AAV3YNB9_9GAST|nr:hypothetical protein PoB_001047000 [Plakobranchus ocellatus]
MQQKFNVKRSVKRNINRYSNQQIVNRNNTIQSEDRLHNRLFYLEVKLPVTMQTMRRVSFPIPKSETKTCMVFRLCLLPIFLILMPPPASTECISNSKPGFYEACPINSVHFKNITKTRQVPSIASCANLCQTNRTCVSFNIRQNAPYLYTVLTVHPAPYLYTALNATRCLYTVLTFHPTSYLDTVDTFHTSP